MSEASRVTPHFADVMLDLETFGTAPGCVIPAIGAVQFDPETGMGGPRFYAEIDIEDAARHGLGFEAMTVKWWLAQSDAARGAVTGNRRRMPLVAALHSFAAFLPPDARIWGNGADFDPPILAEAYRRAGIDIPWKPYAARCYRTLKNLRRDIPMERTGTHHNALDDAISQARHACALLQALRPPQPAAPPPPAAEFHGVQAHGAGFPHHRHPGEGRDPDLTRA